MSNNKDFKVKNGIQPTVYHEGLGTVVSGVEGYYLAGASYDSVSFSVNAPAPSPRETMFNTDGTKMYVLDNGNDSVYQFSLSTGFDVSTASYDSVSFSVTSQASNPQGLAFNNNGTKMYVVGEDNDTVYQYTLSTGFDLSAASYDSVSFSVASQEATPSAVVFNNDGTKMYICGEISDAVHQYTLSTGFDLSTASYDSVSFDYSSQATTVLSMAFNNDGTKMFLSDAATDTIYQYGLSTAFNVSTASYDSVSFSVASQDANPHGIVFNATGDKLYVTGWSSDTIYQYSTALATAQLDLSTGSVFDYTPTSDVQVTLSNPAASGTVSGATLLLSGGGAGYSVDGGSYDNVSFSTASQGTSGYGFFFKPDGTKFYTTDFSNNAVYQYDLSTAWDITTATYSSNSLSVTQAIELHFRSDGLRLMVIDDGDTVKQYSLSTAWDLSTASYDNKSFSVSGQDTSVYSFFFKDDGTKMYIGGNINDSVFQYTLSTAWDISTASYDSVSFSVAATLAGAPTAMYFKPDGTSMFLTRNSTKLIEYPLSTAWDLSTASYTGVFYESFSTSIGGGSNPEVYGLSFKDDGTKFYVFASGSASLNSVYQFSSVAGYTITYDPTLEWPGGTAPTAPAIGETDVVTFNTRDGGSTYQGVLAIDGAK